MNSMAQMHVKITPIAYLEKITCIMEMWITLWITLQGTRDYGLNGGKNSIHFGQNSLHCPYKYLIIRLLASCKKFLRKDIKRILVAYKQSASLSEGAGALREG